MAHSVSNVKTLYLEAAAGPSEAARLLAAGALVALPTETVYGLAADATRPEAVAAIYAAKGRPSFNPLIAHLPDGSAARREGLFDGHATRLADLFWPGPLTLVVPAAAGGTVCESARAGLETVALRVPRHPVMRAVLKRFGRPVAAPSANRSGHVSPTTAAHVLADLDGRIAAVLDDGPCPVGLESTVVACLGGEPKLLRPGGVSSAELADALGFVPPYESEAAGRPLGPGLLATHYAPRAVVRLAVDSIEPDEAALLFGPATPDGLAQAHALENLSVTGDLTAAAANLFGALRRLDASGARCIAVVPIPDVGLGEAINDRLRRAAAPRR